MGYVDAIKTMDGISPLLPQRFGNAFATYFVQRTVLDRILSCIRLSLLFFSVFLFLFLPIIAWTGKRDYDGAIALRNWIAPVSAFFFLSRLLFLFDIFLFLLFYLLNICCYCRLTNHSLVGSYCFRAH